MENSNDMNSLRVVIYKEQEATFKTNGQIYLHFDTYGNKRSICISIAGLLAFIDAGSVKVSEEEIATARLTKI